jgi:hypothetical protein
LTNLYDLNLHSNQLTREIPEEICKQGDSSPSLYNNQLCPPYPECIGDNIGYQDTSNCEEPSLCDENMFWSDCGISFECNPTCLNPNPLDECIGLCEIGCFCNEGYIFSDDSFNECILIEECVEIDYCDLNSDGEINILDIILVMNCVLENEGCDYICMDYNEDSNIDVMDIILMINIILDN